MKCPNCGSKDLKVEKKPNGSVKCNKCGYFSSTRLQFLQDKEKKK